MRCTHSVVPQMNIQCLGSDPMRPTFFPAYQFDIMYYLSQLLGPISVRSIRAPLPLRRIRKTSRSNNAIRAGLAKRAA